MTDDRTRADTDTSQGRDALPWSARCENARSPPHGSFDSGWLLAATVVVLLVAPGLRQHWPLLCEDESPSLAASSSVGASPRAFEGRARDLPPHLCKTSAPPTAAHACAKHHLSIVLNINTSHTPHERSGARIRCRVPGSAAGCWLLAADTAGCTVLYAYGSAGGDGQSMRCDGVAPCVCASVPSQMPPPQGGAC